jgi:hypothetical protein
MRGGNVGLRLRRVGPAEVVCRAMIRKLFEEGRNELRGWNMFVSPMMVFGLRKSKVE